MEVTVRYSLLGRRLSSRGHSACVKEKILERLEPAVRRYEAGLTHQVASLTTETIQERVGEGDGQWQLQYEQQPSAAATSQLCKQGWLGMMSEELLV